MIGPGSDMSKFPFVLLHLTGLASSYQTAIAQYVWFFSRSSDPYLSLLAVSIVPSGPDIIMSKFPQMLLQKRAAVERQVYCYCPVPDVSQVLSLLQITELSPVLNVATLAELLFHEGESSSK